MSAVYSVLADSRRIEKDVHQVLDRLSEQQRVALRHTLTHHPKGSAVTHWKIKKVKPDVWQCDLPDGYRIAYTILETPAKVVLILFAGSHDAAAAFLRKG
jgi:mRNA-degrading endonuclease RelE of RelBE toxin-antitoxin system